MKLLDHFEGLRKAQLQEYFVRWFPTEKMTSDPKELVERLQSAMCDPTSVRERFDRLPRSSRDFVVALLTCPSFQGTIEDVRRSPAGNSIETYELENLLENLTSECWIVVVAEASNGVRREVYVLPEEIGEGLKATIDVESRDPVEMLTLAAARTGDSNFNGDELARLGDSESVEARIAALEDESLREAVHLALDHHGGILRLSRWRAVEDGESRLHVPEWRAALEAASLGTTGVLSLKSFGIDLEEECLVVYQEIVESVHESRLRGDLKNDVEHNLGVDLLIDIRRILEIARSEALEVTREGEVFKKTEERLESHLLTRDYRDLFDDSPLKHVLGLCKKLRLLDQGDRYLRPDPIRRRVWLKKKLVPMVRAIFELYQNEYRGNRWSFHQRMIREIFLEELGKFEPETWISAKSLFSLTVARFMANLQERDVAKIFKDLQLEEFHNETLMVPLERLRQDLSYWIVHRLALVGLINLGFSSGKFNSLQLSGLGARLFKLESSESGGASKSTKGEGKLVVNPDFEILLFPGGLDSERRNYRLAAFADRTASEWVNRYRIRPESIKRGVIAGETASEIVAFLEKESGTELPPNIAFSIREWSEGIEPVLKQRVLLLKTQSERGADHLAQLLTEQEIPYERVGEQAIVVRGAKNERRIRDYQDIFQSAGLILE